MTASCLNCFTREMYFQGTFIKKCCVKFVYFQMGSESKENRLSCHFVHPSSVSIAVIHGGTSIENSFLIVVRLFSQTSKSGWKVHFEKCCLSRNVYFAAWLGMQQKSELLQKLVVLGKVHFFFRSKSEGECTFWKSMLKKCTLTSSSRGTKLARKSELLATVHFWKRTFFLIWNGP